MILEIGERTRGDAPCSGLFHIMPAACIIMPEVNVVEACFLIGEQQAAI